LSGAADKFRKCRFKKATRNRGDDSAVDLLRGLAIMSNMTVLEIPGVTDGLDNDFTGQANGALAALKTMTWPLSTRKPGRSRARRSIEIRLKPLKR